MTGTGDHRADVPMTDEHIRAVAASHGITDDSGVTHFGTTLDVVVCALRDSHRYWCQAHTGDPL